MSRNRFALGWIICAVAVVLNCHIAFAEPVKYTGHRLAIVDVQSQADLDLLLSISPDIWTDYVGIGSLPARIPPERMSDLQQSGLHFTIVQENLQDLVDRERVPAGRGTWDAYMDLDQIVSFINNLESQYPTLCNVSSIGTSLEGRDIWMLHITGTPSGSKPAVFYHSLIHCREWITAPVVLVYVLWLR